MVIDRRDFVAGAGSILLMPAYEALGGTIALSDLSQLFVACRQNGQGDYSAAIFDSNGRDLVSLSLPARGHDAVVRPGTNECVVFARRPGNFAVSFCAHKTKQPLWIGAGSNRHFYGHGVFSSDGRLLYSTENDFENDQGVIGIRDATDGYKQIGDVSAGGVGPHDIGLLLDGRTAVVCVGGILTHPESGRMKLNLSDMKPSLTYLDLQTGGITEQVFLPSDLHKLSIRHLAIAKNDQVVFGCQYEGPKTHMPPLIGIHKRGKEPELISAPGEVHAQMKNYVGSIAVDRSREIAAATSPRGDLVTYWDVDSRRYLGIRKMQDVCGIAGTETTGDFLHTTGFGLVARGQHVELSTLTTSYRWDNHVVHFDAMLPHA